mgnify:CR=1 FL=1
MSRNETEARLQERQRVRDMANLSEPSFAAVWDNPEDAEYDNL